MNTPHVLSVEDTENNQDDANSVETIRPYDQEPTGVTECIYADPDYEDEYLRRQKVFKAFLDRP